MGEVLPQSGSQAARGCRPVYIFKLRRDAPSSRCVHPVREHALTARSSHRPRLAVEAIRVRAARYAVHGSNKWECALVELIMSCATSEERQ